MTTQQLTITSDWTPITDGNQTKFLELRTGTLLLHDADTKPASNAPGHNITGSVTISPPTKAWVKVSSGSSATIIIS